MEPLICLASRSPRRRELLLQIGVPHLLLEIDVDESIRSGERPADYVLRVSRDKAMAGLERCYEAECLPVLAADTTVVVDGRMLGKPADRDDGFDMLRMLSGRSHEVYTAVALGHRRLETRLSVSRVSFRPVTAREIQAYWESGEPADKAGGYAIQGLAAQFVSELRGSYSGVMGLPLYETAELLRGAGLELLSQQDNNKLK
jgi:septum formation protein